METFLLNCRLLLENKRAVCDSPCLIATPSTKIAEMCLGDQVNHFRLEDWAQILDVFKDQKPPWVSDETYEFIDSYRVFSAITSKTNRTSCISNFIFRFLLRIYRLNFRFGFGEQLSRLLGICLKKLKR